jgi:hypothetical protein
MRKYKARVLGSDNCTPRELLERHDAPRPDFQGILDLIDMDDPAWPATASILREMAESGVELDEPTVAVALKVGAQRWKVALRAAAAPLPSTIRPGQQTLSAAGSIVYYIRRSHLIKIGTTADPPSRFRDLLPNEILAFEPGGMAEESWRHRQFAHLQVRGEHFRPAPELMVHVQSMRDLHGDPDPSWPTAPESDDCLVPPVRSAKVVTGAEAAELGFLPTTLNTWVHRGVLSRAGKEGRINLYYLDDLLALRGRLGAPA